MAVFTFSKVLVWDIGSGGTVRYARNQQIKVIDPNTGTTPAGLTQGGVPVTVLTADQQGRVDFSTVDVTTVILESPTGVQDRITSQDAIESAAGYVVSEDAAVSALVSNGASSTRASLETWGTGKGWITQSAGDARWVKWSATGHIGIEKADPTNARIYIGEGAGTLPDNGRMGLKVDIDTPPGARVDGIQSDVNITPTSAAGSVRSMLARVDVADTSANTGDSVALWGDAWITQPSARNAWGGNIYGSIQTGVAYAAVMVGLEVGWENYGTLDNTGGGLHVVGKGAGSTGAFGVMITSDPATAAATFRTHLLMPSDKAPAENYLWIGDTAATVPTGVPLFQIAAGGHVSIGGPVATASPVLSIKRSADTEATITIGANSSEIRFGNGTAATDSYVKRGGSGIVAVGNSLWVGTAVANGGGYMQMWEQTAAPAAAPTNSLRLFAQDDGTGKTQLCVRFPTGAAVVLATEV